MSSLPNNNFNADSKTPTLALARDVLQLEANEIVALSQRLDARFADAVSLILNCHGRIVVSGMGKSGHIGGKIASTFASTGTPAFFMHPAEASHGDLGMIMAGDIVLALSNSGESDEILAIIPPLKRLGAQIIAITGNDHSSLAKAADIHLSASVSKEACPLGLAPTSSTTVSPGFLAASSADAWTKSTARFLNNRPPLGIGSDCIRVRRALQATGECFNKVRMLPVGDSLVTLRQFDEIKAI